MLTVRAGARLLPCSGSSFPLYRKYAQVNSGREKRGRPPGRTVPVAIPIRLATEQVAALDRYAEAEGKTRSEAVRTAVSEHLKAKGYLK